MLDPMVYAKNQRAIADGQITLYQRDDVKDQVWHLRIKQKGKRGYVRRTTGETDYARAESKALQILGELKQRQAQNLPLTSKKFNEIAASYLRHAETEKKEGKRSAGRHELIKGTLKNYMLPYFGKRDIALIQKKDLIDYRKWRQDYWFSGPGKELKAKRRVRPKPATLKNEWVVLRGVFSHAVDLGVLPSSVMYMLKHEKNKVERRPAFTSEEYRDLWIFMRKWVKATKHTRVAQDRQLLRDYVLIMTNSGMRKGEARHLKWRDVTSFTNEHGMWVTLAVSGKTGSRMVVCQPGTERYFNRQRKRGHHTDLDDYVFCHRDGKPIEVWPGFNAMLKEAKLQYDSKGQRRTIYSLRHTYATLRLENGTNVYWLKQNMGTSVAMIEKHYGQTRVLVGIEHETARRRKAPNFANASTAGKKVKAGTTEMPKVGGALLMQGGTTSTTISTLNVPTLIGLAALPIDPANPVPLGSVDATPVEEGQPDIEIETSDIDEDGTEELGSTIANAEEE
jgi:integrase